MGRRVWRTVDAVAHLLYCPAMLGRRAVRYHWLHRIPFVDTPAFRPGRKRSSRVAGQEKANRRQGDSASTATGRHPPLTRKLIECEA
jgi:hypothetical protein